jgi:predicted PurR-regulated permease PerM
MRTLMASLLIVVSSTVVAQTAEQAARLLNLFDTTGLEFSYAIKNVSEMASGVPAAEGERLDRIAEFAASADSRLNHLSDLVFLYANISSPEDRALTRKVMTRTAKYVLAIWAVSLKSINRNLAGLRSPAAVAEAQKVRDRLQTLTDAVRQTFPN